MVPSRGASQYPRGWGVLNHACNPQGRRVPFLPRGSIMGLGADWGWAHLVVASCCFGGLIHEKTTVNSLLLLRNPAGHSKSGRVPKRLSLSTPSKKGPSFETLMLEWDFSLAQTDASLTSPHQEQETRLQDLAALALNSGFLV